MNVNLAIGFFALLSFAPTTHAKPVHSRNEVPSSTYVNETGIASNKVEILRNAIQTFAPGKNIECFDLGGSGERCGSGYDHAPYQEDGIECYTQKFNGKIFGDCSRSLAGEPLLRVQLRIDGRIQYKGRWAGQPWYERPQVAPGSTCIEYYGLISNYCHL